MTLIVNILNRDFTTPPIKPYDFKVDKLTWSCFGGSDQGIISAYSTADRIIEFSSLIRCPVIIVDHDWEACWHGYVHQIEIAFDNVIFTVDLDELYNRVQVRYSFISPDNKLADQSETPFVSNYASRSFYGTRENILYRRNIDDDFAIGLLETFITQSAWPGISYLPAKPSTAKLEHQQAKITLRLSGWFSTLDWRYYQDLDGLYANHGPGPGVLPFGDGVTSQVAQSFRPGKTVNAKFAYFMLRKVGTPTSNLTAKLYSSSGGNPGTLLATSAGIPGADLPAFGYTWFKFTFASAVTLAAATRYWIAIDPNTSSALNHYQLRTDENNNYVQTNEHGRALTTSWVNIPSVTAPNSRPDLYFRVVTIADTGKILKDIATAGNQFFTGVTSFTTGVTSSPYRDNAKTCLSEIYALMNLGTSNHRRVLANVTGSRELVFYEQPERDDVTGFMDRHGRFFTHDMKLLPPYRPPIGQNVMLSSHDRVLLPFDFERTPTYFVDRFIYQPQ